MTIWRKQLGKKGEDYAAEYLKGIGYEVICRNYTCGLGEIDLIAVDRRVTVFVEVRSHSTVKYGLPQESVTRRKQHKLRQVAWNYLIAHGKTDSSCRFDVIGILFDKHEGVGKLDHIINAF
ncbi:MAG: YraN family protein [Peptococcaceae bacterium]|nr:YraN family protein [Candidatus Syntrophopropionicum ammoniitolerans]